MDSIEDYVCKLYGCRKKTTSVNSGRMEIFSTKHLVENKVIDLSLLPPCQTSLHLHILRSNYVARLWKKTLESIVSTPNIVEHGWNVFGEIELISGDPFPDNVTEMLPLSMMKMITIVVMEAITIVILVLTFYIQNVRINDLYASIFFIMINIFTRPMFYSFNYFSLKAAISIISFKLSNIGNLICN